MAKKEKTIELEKENITNKDITNKNTAIIKKDNTKSEAVNTTNADVKSIASSKVNKKELNNIAKEKAARYIILKEKQYQNIYDLDKELTLRRAKEEKIIKQNTKKAIIFLASIVGFPIGLYKLFKARKHSKLIKNPFELQKIIIIEESLKKHNEKNKRILEVYIEEKKRIKKLKKLPFKILNHINFLISMLLIILFFFILDIGVAPTALVLFSSFCLMYFAVGLIMHIVFYMVAENKTREKLSKLEEEKNRLLAEEKLKSEQQVRAKIEKERKIYESQERLRMEEDRLRKQEEIRIAAEEAELKEKLEEESRLMAIAREEKERLEEEQLKMQKQFVYVKELAPPPPTKAELAQEKEALRNEFDKSLLTEINREFIVPDVGGIEYFGNVDKLKKEYAPGIVFEDIDSNESSVSAELDNTILTSATAPAISETNEITDFDTTDIEEAKDVIFRKARRQVEAKAKDDLIEKQVKEDIIKKQMKSSNNSGGQAVSGKSFMIIKEMLKNG